MLFSKAFAFSLLSAAFAAPALPGYKYDLGRRSAYGPHGIAPGDYATLLLAANLELLELNYWIQGLQNYSDSLDSLGYNYKFYTNEHRLQEIAHYGEINSVLYGQGPKNCTYVFPGVFDAKSFNKNAQIVTAVGEAAYISAEKSWVNRDYAEITAQILGNEARQNSFLRQAANLNFYDNFFDTPLTANQVYSLASPMIKSCPSSNPKLPFTPVPAVNASFASGAASGGPGDSVKLIYPKAVDTTKAAVLVVSQLNSYRATLNTASDHKSATFNLPSAVTNGTVFAIISTASGTPFPVPDSSVLAIGALAVN